MEKQRIFIVNNGDFSFENQPLCFSKDISNEEILNSIAELDNKKSASFSNAVSSLIARKILHYKIPVEAKVVFPISSLVMRSMKTNAHYDGTLFSLYQALIEEEKPELKIELGISLGDLATYNAAGLRVPKHVQRIMSRETFSEYAKNMALVGYQSAVTLVKNRRAGRVTSTFVNSAIVELLEMHDKIVEVVRCLQDEGF